MKQLAYALALTGSCVLAASIASTPAVALETYEAKMAASDAASQARLDMFEAFGFKRLKAGQYLWRDVPESAGPERVVIGLSDQLAFRLVAKEDDSIADGLLQLLERQVGLVPAVGGDDSPVGLGRVVDDGEEGGEVGRPTGPDGGHAPRYRGTILW